MQTASAFRKAGFEVVQSQCYVDPETGKGREIDVMARHVSPYGLVETRFFVECKSTAKPWLLLCSSEGLHYNRLFAFGAASEKMRDALSKRLLEFLPKFPWLAKAGLTGYSLRQAFADKDAAFVAAMSVAKACDEFVREANTRGYQSLSVAFPVVVINSPLIRCLLGEQGDIELEEIQQGEFLFTTHLPHYFGTCIRVVTAKQLPKFTMEAMGVAAQIQRELKPEEDTLWEEMKLRRPS